MTMHQRQRDHAVRWERKRVRRLRDHEAGKVANFIGPAAYRHRQRLNEMADRMPRPDYRNLRDVPGDK